MFAFLIYDSRSGRVFFARDRFGKKPLYYAQNRGRLGVCLGDQGASRPPGGFPSSEPAGLAPLPQLSVDPGAGHPFRGHSQKSPPPTAGAGRPAPGSRLAAGGSSPPTEPTCRSADAAADVRALFTAAVRKRMMSDVPFGVYLSGGIDSTANVATMSQMMSQPVNTFSIAFAGEPELNELPEAARVARHFRTNHCAIEITDEDALQSLPEIVHHQDEPIADPVCVPLYHLAKRTKEAGVTVVQIGEGSDELFFGYRRLRPGPGGGPPVVEGRAAGPRVRAQRRGHESSDGSSPGCWPSSHTSR